MTMYQPVIYVLGCTEDDGLGQFRTVGMGH
jgi:hypothetical protein